MRHLTRIGLLVVLPMVALPAQDARQDLARAIQLEDQEHDLAKAEAMYRKLLADGTLGGEQKAQAELRLGRVLMRLGKADEAKALLERAAASGGEVGVLATKVLQGQGQDAERLKELRAQARVLVQKALAQPKAPDGSNSSGIPCITDYDVARNLLWIGAAAVPEIVAALEPLATELDKSARLPEGHPGRDEAMTGLMGLLWKYGGKEAERFLASIITNGNVELRVRCAKAAAQLERPEMLAIAEGFLGDPDPKASVQAALLEGLSYRIPAIDIVTAAVHGSPAMKTLGMWKVGTYWQNLNHTTPRANTLDQLLPVVREALASTDPELGRRGQQFLLSQAVQASSAGIELLLREFPKLDASGLQYIQANPASDIDAKAVLPALLGATRAVGAVAGRDRTRLPVRQTWLATMAAQLVHHLDEDALAAVLELIDLGYDVPVNGSLSGWLNHNPPRVHPDQAATVFDRLERVYDVGNVLRTLSAIDLPASLWPQLRSKAEEFERDNRSGLDLFWEAMAHTGVPEVATWLLEYQRRHPGSAGLLVQPLLDLGRRTQADPVKAAMRSLLAVGQALGGEASVRLFLALASMGDTAMFDELQFETIARQSAVHPYGQAHRAMTPQAYLLQDNFEPPIGLSHSQVVAAIRTIARKEPAFFALLNPGTLSVSAIPNEVLGEVSRQVLIGMTRSEEGLSAQQWFSLQQARSLGGQQMLEQWMLVVVQRLSDKQHPSPDLVACIEQCLGDRSADLRLGMLKHLDTQVVPLVQRAVEDRLEDRDDRCAGQAAELLVGAHIADDAKWLQRLLQNQHGSVRARAVGLLATKLGESVTKPVLPMLGDRDDGVRLAACKYFAGIVSKDAVPELLARLKDDNEAVRNAAADALQKIRFYQEQQAHWERILKGVDASAGTATEKLLAQAKPGQPKEQRVLAIQSLGALGAPEALPFLIEWLKDQDADVATAARAAVGNIHQRAGVK